MARPKGLANNDITPKQKAFALALVMNGGNRTKAAKAAGYSAKTADVMGSELSRNPKVRAELRRMTVDMLDDLAPKAVRTLDKLLRNHSGYVRLEAAKDILNRNMVGVLKQAPTTAAVTVNINLVPVSGAMRVVNPTPLIDSTTGQNDRGG